MTRRTLASLFALAVATTVISESASAHDPCFTTVVPTRIYGSSVHYYRQTPITVHVGSYPAHRTTAIAPTTYYGAGRYSYSWSPAPRYTYHSYSRSPYSFYRHSYYGHSYGRRYGLGYGTRSWSVYRYGF